MNGTWAPVRYVLAPTNIRLETINIYAVQDVSGFATSSSKETGMFGRNLQPPMNRCNIG
jgi:hypothetical protein